MHYGMDIIPSLVDNHGRWPVHVNNADETCSSQEETLHNTVFLVKHNALKC